MMRFLAVCAAGWLLSVPALSTDLYPGVPLRFTISPQAEPALLSIGVLLVEPGTETLVIDLETDDPAHDLDLFARVGVEVERAPGGNIVADFLSATPGSGDEEIELVHSELDPLQTGAYYVAVEVQTLETQISGTVAVETRLGTPPATFLVSRFNFFSDDGWTANFPATGVPGESVSDFAAATDVLPPGFLRMVSAGSENQHFVVAPPKFLGNLTFFENALFGFDFRHSGGLAPSVRIDLRLLGSGSVFRWLGPVPPAGEWIHVEAPLDGPWTRIFGEATLQEALTNVERIELSMDHAFGPETADLDNFFFTGDSMDPPPFLSGGTASSTFELTTDGWSRNHPPVSLPGASNGSPAAAIAVDRPGKDSEGFLKFVDGGGFGEDCLVLPPKYLGDLTVLDRPWVEFDHLRISGPGPARPISIRMIGGGSVYFSTLARPRDLWRRTRIPFLERYWIPEGDPAPFERVLSNVQRIELCLDLSPGPEEVGIDNFYLREDFTPTVGRALAIDRESLTLTATVGGAAPPPEVVEVTSTGGEVIWQAVIEPSTTDWLRVSPGEGSTPAFLEISADPAGLAAGTHNAVLEIDAIEFGVRSKTMEVTFIVSNAPDAPVLSPGGVVHAASPSLPLSTGVLATAYGLRFADESRLVPIVGRNMLPTNFLGVEVLILDREGGLIGNAPLLYIGPSQINFQIPLEVAGLEVVDVVIAVDGVRSQPQSVVVAAASPGIFVFNGNRAAALNQDGTLNSTSSPAPRGSSVQVFLSGIGSVTPPVGTGKLAPASPLSLADGLSSATLGGSPVRILSLTLAPNLLGVAQLNIEASGDFASGDQILVLTVNGMPSNEAVITVE